MKLFKLGAAAALVVALVGGPAAAQKATRGETKPKPTNVVSAEQKAEAASFAQRAGYACTVGEVRYLGQSDSKDAAGKKVTRQLYEVSCNEGLGYILAGNAADVSGYNCLAAETGSRAAKAQGKEFGVTCAIPRNLDVKLATQPFAQKAGLACTVTGGEWIGRANVSGADRYEVACSEGGGYVLDVTPAAVRSLTCLAAVAGGYECKYTPKADQVRFLSKLAAPASQTCEATDARYIVSDNKTGNSYYEIACAAPKPGFVVEVSSAGAFSRSIDCLRATGISGGCKLTDTAALQAATTAQYAALLNGRNLACTVAQARPIGKETAAAKRDVVEFSCPEQTAGLVAWTPAVGAAGKFEAFDCFTAEARGVRCQLTGKPALLAALNPVMKPHRADCEVSDYRAIALSVNDAAILEVACGNGRGYIVEMAKTAASVAQAIPCHISAQRGGEKCTIPGNGRAQGLNN